jgi:hypothetical protein
VLPVLRIEQLDGEEAAEIDRGQGSHQLVERGDAVTRVDTVRIVDLRARRFSRVVVDVEDRKCGAMEQAEATEARAPLVKVIAVQEETRLRVGGLRRDVDDLAESAERLAGPHSSRMGVTPVRTPRSRIAR